MLLGYEKFIYFSISDVVIGFEETEYIFDEDSGTVTVNVVVLEGEISGTVRVRVATRDGSATSKAVG